MKICVRTPNNPVSVVGLLKQLLQLPGDQLLLATGKLANFQHLPFDDIVTRTKAVALVVGSWANGVASNDIAHSADAFDDQLASHATRLNVPLPRLTLFVGAQWHSKVAIFRNSSTNETVGAIIGSSNVTDGSLRTQGRSLNSEVDVLIEATDGSDAKAELEQLYKAFKSQLKPQQMFRN